MVGIFQLQYDVLVDEGDFGGCTVDSSVVCRRGYRPYDIRGQRRLGFDGLCMAGGNAFSEGHPLSFNVEYADGSVERWAFWDDDCRNNATPEADPKFFNVYRFVNLSDEWAHSWKSKNDSEGVGMLATFRVYMNNDKSADFIHERSFR